MVKRSQAPTMVINFFNVYTSKVEGNEPASKWAYLQFSIESCQRNTCTGVFLEAGGKYHPQVPRGTLGGISIVLKAI